MASNENTTKDEIKEDNSASASTAKPSEEELKKLELLSLLDKRTKKQLQEDPKRSHDFWDTQPVPKLAEKVESSSGPIDPIKTIDEIKKDPYPLPTGFVWEETDITDKKILDEVYNLLTENYVEDDDNMFRFDYSKEFLLWALKPPGWLKQWHVGVRYTKTGKLMGFITAIPSTIQVYEQTMKMVEINFLCVHKKLRDKRLAPVLIKEITRRVNLTGIFQAVYTAGRVLPKPVARCRYYHRSINPKKLIEVGFSHLGPNMTIPRTEKLYKLADKPQSNFIPMKASHVASATKLINNYLKTFQLKTIYEDADVDHWLLPRKDIISTYVIEKVGENGAVEVTDMVSFYTLPSSILGHPKHKTLKAAYSYYNIATSVPLVTAMKDALILAKQESFDVYNCLDLMENEKVLQELKFGRGDGNLQYYLYNWRCPEMTSPQVGLVLL